MIVLYLYAALFIVFGISVYGVVVKPNIVKKLIALSILGDTANTLIIFLGYRTLPKPWPPVFPELEPSLELIEEFTKLSVDPLPQVLVITAIVINMAVTALLAFLAIQVYRLYGTLDFRKVLKLRGW
ncbi:MAG: Na+/H+ antiporter subunit C [Thermoprotei archaeon]|nr:MAG: Na+/H+ antiporter subunit C [Thermoprotei archaeon]